ncbi:MAG: inositol monophosphatase [Candidatus Delongbacteria bacterium]|nr:inositol monophosphatase [Candidatus Delongbacteria bacterium]
MNHRLFMVAKEAVENAGELIVGNFRQLEARDVQLKGINDFVTRVDQQSEQLIKRIILDSFPDHQILAEESGLANPSGEYLWVVDPLDGTANFIHGIPHFSISIAVICHDVLELGVIYNPILKELFMAFPGEGSFLNNHRIHIADDKPLQQAFGATGFPFKTHQLLPAYSRAFEDLFGQSQGMRRIGAASLDLAYTACGRFDYFWESFLCPWDFMAGILIVREAGGIITNFMGTELGLKNDSVVAASASLHSQVLSIIQTHFLKPESH